MGSNCSSRQNHKDRDSISSRSEESPGYQAVDKKIVEEVTKPPLLQREELNSSTKSQNVPISPQIIPQVSNQVQKDDKNLDLNIKENKIVVYISTPDSQDCKIEKGLVHSQVYPELRDYCKSFDFELHIVDLHWSVQDKTSEPEELFIHELSRQNEGCFLIPLVFLNTNLGTLLLPKTLENADFLAISNSEGGGILKKWYVFDSEAQPPCYRLLPASSHIKGLKSHDRKTKETSLNEWKKEVETILTVMLTIFSQELRETYLTTIVEQEVHSCVLMSRELAKRTIWFSKNLKNPEPTTQIESELKRRTDNLHKSLKNELKENHIIHITPNANQEIEEQHEYLSQVSQSINKILKNIIDTIIEDWSKNQDFNTNKEILIHKKNAFKEAQSTVNRQQLLDTVFNWKGKGPIIFHGPGGSGKTTLLSRLAHQVDRNNSKVVFRKVGLTRHSSTLVGLLQSVTRQLDPGKKRRIHTVEEYAKILPDCIEKSGPDLYLIIDGIDHFKEYGVNNLTWIPSIIPDGARMILSLSDSNMVQELKDYLKNDTHFIEIPNLDKSERDRLLMSSILEYNHSYDPQVKNTIPDTCQLPLHIKSIAWMATWSKEYDLNLSIENNLQDQMSKMLDQLEIIFGRDKIEKSICIVLSVKYGIQDSEMIDILSSDETFHTATYLPWAGSCIFWSKITRHLGPFLEWGDRKTLQIKDKTLINICLQRYKNRIPWARETLKCYFLGKLMEKGVQSRFIEQKDKYGKCYNLRRYEELPYLTIKTESKYNKLFEHDFIVDKIKATDTNQLLEDIFLLETNEDLSWLKGFLEENEEALTYDGGQFYSLLNRRFFIENDPNQSKLALEFKKLAQNPPKNSLIEIKSECEEGKYNLIRRLPGHYVVGVATDKSEISVFDVRTCEKVRTIHGVVEPTDLKMVDETTCVVLSGRELLVYDLDKGTLKTKLKGVMNQKMPFFALHDANHLVALSRNRMYVNLMNLESGDCVTTFKAGEDRFLNSLLVSGDGKILVCGDETQKPSPMLVWNLASRKLLYDIRIPQHEFVSKLSAITHQGNYVCFVTKEVDNSPNYLVVYDLQSGTLFKKWKPGVDTTCVDISPNQGCLIACLFDTRILIYDLITGNCRHVLKGHTSPVDTIRLDEQSTLFISYTKNNDRSVRIWDISKGVLISSYTPDVQPLSCEISQKYIIVATNKLISLRLKGPDYDQIDEEDKSVYKR